MSKSHEHIIKASPNPERKSYGLLLKKRDQLPKFNDSSLFITGDTKTGDDVIMTSLEPEEECKMNFDDVPTPGFCGSAL